jgi:histidinol phosphatase-like PHP family hydrolase
MMGTTKAVDRRRGGPSNGALAEALFALAEREPPGDRRLALLRAGYTAFDTPDRASRVVLRDAPPWLRPLLGQLVACHGEDALAAAVQRLGCGAQPRLRDTRDRYLSRAEVADVLDTGPADLRPERIRGAFHWHTRDSDGRGTLDAMARACERRGASWAVVTDHSRGLDIASGECVVAAVHRRFDSDRDQTERLLRAISTPGVHVLAHPRGRHFHSRPGLRARWETVFSACAAEDVAVEINGFPRRQDLDWELARLALEADCDFVLASDAHAPNHLEFDAYASAIAMKAEIPRHRILNAGHVEDFRMWLTDR